MESKHTPCPSSHRTSLVAEGSFTTEVEFSKSPLERGRRGSARGVYWYEWNTVASVRTC